MSNGSTRVYLAFVPFLALAALILASPAAALASAPSIEGESVSNVTATDATLEAQINPQSASRGAYYQFQLAKDPSEFAAEFTCPTEGFPAGSSLCLGIASQQGALPIRSIPAATVEQAVSLDLASVGTSLEPGGTYYYRVIAARIVQTEDTIAWEEPTVYGQDMLFKTPSGSAPTVDGESASGISTTDATLEALVNLHEAAPHGAYYQFQVAAAPGGLAMEILCPATSSPGSDGCIGNHAAGVLPIGFIPSNLANPLAAQPVVLDLSAAGLTLQPATTYHYRVLVALAVQTEDTIQWEEPTASGPDQTFTTQPLKKEPPRDEHSCPFVATFAAASCSPNPFAPPIRHRCAKSAHLHMVDGRPRCAKAHHHHHHHRHHHDSP